MYVYIYIYMYVCIYIYTIVLLSSLWYTIVTYHYQQYIVLYYYSHSYFLYNSWEVLSAGFVASEIWIADVGKPYKLSFQIWNALLVGGFNPSEKY